MKTYVHKVNYYETDKMGVTHHSNYIRFMEEARVDYLEKLGYGYDRMEREGIVSPVVGLEVAYKKTTTFPDEIYVYVKTAKCMSFKLIISYEMKVNDEVVFTGKSSHCFLDSTGRPVSLEKSFPELYKKLIENME